MSGCMEFDYYYGIEAEQFSFYRIPKVLVKDGRFQALSSDAKLLYGLMLDRMSLSMKNGWLDGKNRAYIYYTLENIMEDLGCGKAKCVKILSELDNRKGIGLIEKKRQGLGRPDIIYVKNFATLESGAGQKNMDGNILGCGCQDVDRPDTDTQVQYADNPDTFFPAQDVDGFCHDDQFMDENIPDPAIPMQAKTIFKEDHSDGCGGFSESEIYAQLMELHNHGDIDGNSRTGEPEIRIDGSLATGSLEVRKPNLQKFENRTSGSLETVDIGTENWNFDRMQAGQTMDPGMDGIGKQDTHGQNNNILRVQAAKFEEVRESNFKKSENQTSRSPKIELQEV